MVLGVGSAVRKDGPTIFSSGLFCNLTSSFLSSVPRLLPSDPYRLPSLLPPLQAKSCHSTTLQYHSLGGRQVVSIKIRLVEGTSFIKKCNFIVFKYIHSASN